MTSKALLSGSKAYVRHGAAGVHCMRSPNIELVIRTSAANRTRSRNSAFLCQSLALLIVIVLKLQGRTPDRRPICDSCRKKDGVNSLAAPRCSVRQRKSGGPRLAGG